MARIYIIDLEVLQFSDASILSLPVVDVPGGAGLIRIYQQITAE